MKLRMAIVAALSLWAVSCATHIRKAEIAPTAQPDTEIDRLEGELRSAEAKQFDVLSPEYYRASRKYLSEARRALEKGKKGSAIIENIAYGQGALDQASEVAQKVEAVLPEVVKARQLAVDAQAARYAHGDMERADRYFRSVTKNFESGSTSVDPNDRVDLQRAYTDAELHAVLGQRLGRASHIHEVLRRNRAERDAPKSFTELGVKLKEAQIRVATNLRSPDALDSIENDLNATADHALLVLQETKKARNESVEDLAIEAVQQRKTLSKVSENLVETSRDLAQAKSEQQKLQEVADLDRMFEKARQKFTSDEAEVMRDGDKLVIRLRGLKFPTNRAELTGPSVSLLKKVSKTIAEMPTEKRITVEGHTDATGSPDRNANLSQMRAQTVVEYLVSENVVKQDQISAEGLGDRKPLASNKTREGRAENRRVDVIIVPEVE